MRIFDLVREQEKWRGEECVNIIASENVMSPLANKVYNSEFMHRYAEGDPWKRYYQGTKFIDEIEEKTNELAKKYFRSEQSDLRPLSGAMANLCVFCALGNPGDKMMAPSVPMGAHITHQKYGAAGISGFDIYPYEFDYKTQTLDLEKTEEKMKELKPKLITFGGSFFTFPHPMKELSKIGKDLGAKVMYDAAHVLGLIGAGRFQDPLREGADMITSSTHKTFPGPQGGVVIGNTDEETWHKVRRVIFPGLVSNHHLHRLPAMYVVLNEMMYFGKDYADQIIKNAQYLGKELYDKGFDVLWKNKGFTQSHQVGVDVVKQGGGRHVAQELEKANIIVNKNLLPYDEIKKSHNPSGIRIGVQEMTRYGMKEPEMKQIAEFMERVFMKNKDPEKLKPEVVEFRKKYPEIQYCFKTEEEFYEHVSL